MFVNLGETNHWDYFPFHEKKTAADPTTPFKAQKKQQLVSKPAIKPSLSSVTLSKNRKAIETKTKENSRPWASSVTPMDFSLPDAGPVILVLLYIHESFLPVLSR